MRRTLPALFLVAAVLALALALTAVGSLAGFSATHSGWVGEPATSMADLWSVPPVEVAVFLALAGAFALFDRHPDSGVTGRHRAYYYSGIALLLAAVCTPLGGMAQQGLLSAHMLQHTILGGFAPLLLLLGIPREAAEHFLRPATIARLQRVQSPAVAFTLWTLATVVWLLPSVHHHVLVSPWLWVVQQMAFLAFGLLMWAPVIERVSAPLWFGTGWKGSYMTGVWTVGLVIANIYWFSGTAFYGSHAAAAEAWNFTPLEDQANSGTVMMLSHCMLAFGAIVLLFFRQAQEGDMRQKLIEAGVDRTTVEQAIRGGTVKALAGANGVSTVTRGGID